MERAPGAPTAPGGPRPTHRATDCAVCGHPLDSKSHEINCESAA